MKHIVSFSGGKDSTAMLLMMLERGITIDKIIFLDTGMEFPGMYEHIIQVEQYIGRKIEHVHPEHGFKYHLLEYKKKKGRWKGQKGYGWPNMKIRWCTSSLKREPYLKFLRQNNIKARIEYYGIAADEYHRTKNNRGAREIQYPLVDWKITERQALQYCYDKGFTWGGLYEHFDRVSCWCCPLKSLPELKTLWFHYPELWKRLKEMDQACMTLEDWPSPPRKFKDTKTVEELEQQFERERNSYKHSFFPLNEKNDWMWKRRG